MYQYSNNILSTNVFIINTDKFVFLDLVWSRLKFKWTENAP